MKISQLVNEISLGDYPKKAKMASALARMGAAFAPDPAQRERELAIAKKREKGLGMAKTRTDKIAATNQAKAKADYEQSIRDKYAGVDIDAEIEKLKPAIQRAYHEYQYGARNTWSQGKDEYDRLRGKVQELERAKKILSGESESATGGGVSTGSISTAPGKQNPDSIVV